jgi:hypothetical protein
MAKHLLHLDVKNQFHQRHLRKHDLKQLSEPKAVGFDLSWEISFA